MSDQVSSQFRKWVGLDIAMEQTVYAVWSVYSKHCNVERVILITVAFVSITTQRCPLITYDIAMIIILYVESIIITQYGGTVYIGIAMVYQH